LHGDFEPPAPTPWTQTVARDESRRLEAALLGLADAYREALLLVCVDGMPPEQAAKVLDIDPATLRKRLSRGRAHLRTALGEELP
jgi:RNA polymerase sigma-70 factor (ECF subfamily)